MNAQKKAGPKGPADAESAKNPRNTKLTTDDLLEIHVMARNMVAHWIHKYTEESAADRFEAENVVKYTTQKRKAREDIVKHLRQATGRRASSATINRRLGAEIAKLKRDSPKPAEDMRDACARVARTAKKLFP